MHDRNASAQFLRLLVALACGPSILAADPSTTPRRDLTELSLAELAEIKVTTVQKKPEPLQDTPAAISVITSDEIEASGATSVPALLRRVPGVHVARLDASQWAIGIRGFANSVARSQLALMDGRSLYTPLFAGTYWDVQNLFLEDVDRIEVVRGPGGTLWGANAVNGVINIITKSSHDTPGGVIVIGGGDQERVFGRGRFGGRLGNDATFRVYGSYFDRAGEQPDADRYDAWHMSQGGFRTDWTPRFSDLVTLQGDVYSGRAGRRTTFATFTPPYVQTIEQDADLTGGNLRARWGRVFSERRELSLQVYYDRTSRKEPNFTEDRDTVDVDTQYRSTFAGRQDFVAGLGYRLSDGRTSSVPTIAFVPADRTDHLVSGFVEGTVHLVPSLRLIVGTKVERNDYSDFEFQPSARLAFAAGPKHAFWASVTRAVRTPTRFDRDLVLNIPVAPGAPAFVRLLGDAGFETERSFVYEVGGRAQLSSHFTLEIAAFHNRYPNLVSYEAGAPFPEPGRLVLPLRTANGTKGKVTGVEVSADARPRGRWLLRASYAYLNMQISPVVSSTDTGSSEVEDASPRHQVLVSSTTTLPGRVVVAVFLRGVSRLPSQKVPAYGELNTRVRWQATDHLDVAVAGENLLHEQHLEFGSGTIGGAGAHQQPIRRSFRAEAVVRW
jgi:iron complex outermembrane receptor protein